MPSAGINKAGYKPILADLVWEKNTIDSIW